MTIQIAYPDTTRRLSPASVATPRPPRLVLTVAAHPLLRRIGEQSELGELAEGRPVELARLVPDFRTTDGRLVGPLDDPYISRSPLRLVPRDGGEVVIEPSVKKGSPVWVDGALLRAPVVLGAELLRRGVTIDLAGRVLLLIHTHEVADGSLPKYGLAGESAAIQRVRAEITRAAGLSIPVLIRGESGTGKELIARAIHAASPRAAHPYVALNIAALNAQTAVAELFGHARGSFTGAVQDRAGYFREADGGTLFLDEIGEAPLEVQVMLLRALESGEVQPVGGRPGRRVDVRLLAATDANVERGVLRGEFRLALLHRLAGCEFHAPPLRQRRDDIPRLLVHFLELELRRAGQSARLEEWGADTSPWLSTRAMSELIGHAWPGNVRQLSNVARRMVGALLAGQAFTTVSILGAGPGDEPGPEPAPEAAAGSSAGRNTRAASEFTDDALLEAMQAHGWQISATARALGISRKSVYARIEQSGHMRKARDLSREELKAERARHGGDLVKTADALQVSVRALHLRLRELKLLP